VRAIERIRTAIVILINSGNIVLLPPGMMGDEDFS